MTKLIYFLLLQVFATNGAFAEAKIDCSYKAMHQKRSEFKKLYDKKKYSEAADVLKPIDSNCDSFQSDSEDAVQASEEYCWTKSELGLALYKKGDFFECRSLLGYTMDPRNSCAEGEAPKPYTKAIDTNYALCTSGISKAQAQPKCNLKTSIDAIASIGIDDKGETCLALQNPPQKPKASNLNTKAEKKEESTEESEYICPKVVLLSKNASKKISSQIILETSSAPFEDLCCYIDGLSWFKENGKKYLYLFSKNGPSQPCGGSGTMRVEPSTLFKWDGKTLETYKDTSWGTH